MTHKRILNYFILISLFIVGSCKKGDMVSSDTSSGGGGGNDLQSANIPSNFNYATTQNVSLDISVLAPDNSAIKNISVNILDKPSDQGGKVLSTVHTDANGKINTTVALPTYLTQVVVDAAYVGVLRNAGVNIVGKNVKCTLGGINGHSANIIDLTNVSGSSARPAGYANRSATSYTYMGTYTSDGKPNYLESQNGTVSSSLLSYINSSLPEQRPVPTYHPDYLKTQNETNINVVEESDVWVTFVSEGAGYRNSIVWFSYPTGHAPATETDIDTLHVVYPNASLSGSGGSMNAGNRVKLGRFQSGTTISFGLVADGWNGSAVGAGNWRVFTLDNLNPESNASLKRHAALLYDNNEGLFLLGFEDIRRDYGSCDNDFNDCVMYVSSNPVEGISTTGVNSVASPTDTDGDGVSDTYDDFPNDPTKAYIDYYPSANSFSTVAFEDNWPYKGDYDVNDLVVNYRYTMIKDPLNRTLEIKADYAVNAIGATFRNGFGVEFPFNASSVSHVTGSNLTTNGGVATLGSNGCETGQTKAVIIPFDDAFHVAGRDGYLNVMNGDYKAPDTVHIDITLNGALTDAQLGTAPFNPFIIINQTRGRECHLPGYTPTQKADQSYFRQGQDNTRPSSSIYYKTSNSLPWGLSFPQSFEYPLEGKAIDAAYTYFVQWAQSGGSTYANWHSDANNKVSGNIYHK